MYSLETPRLKLRPFVEQDFDFLVALNADPDVARYIGHGNPRTRSETRAFFEHILDSYARDARGHLLVCERETGIPVGRCGLTLLEAEATPLPGEPVRWYWFGGSAPAGMAIVNETELGYVFAKAAWGKGYATECAAAVRDYAFTGIGVDSLVSAIAPDNQASKNVARKLGLVRSGVAIAFDSPYDCYRLTVGRWRELSAGAGP